MSNIAYNLIATVPTLEPDGHWWWTLRSHKPHRHGPFSTEAEATQHRERRFLHLRRKASSVGGWGWRSTHTRWHVLLPDEVPCEAPEMKNEVCSQHLPLPNVAK